MKKNIILIMCAFLLLCGCKKDKMVRVATVNINEFSVTPAQVTAKIEGRYDYPASFKSVKVVVSKDKSMSNPQTVTASLSSNVFKADVNNLEEATPYYCYCIYDTGYGTMKGEQVRFVTKEYHKPTVTTKSVTDIWKTTATCGGNVTSDGDAEVTARGVCWNTSPNPTINNAHTSNSTGTGSYTSYMTGLTANTTYYVRAYATNFKGTSYGEEKTFKTQQNGSVTPLSDYLGTFNVSAYNWDSDKWESWSGTTISAYTNSNTNTTWIKVLGICLGGNYEFYSATGEYDETTGEIHLYGGWYFPSLTFYFTSNPDVYYYSVFYPVYVEGNSFWYIDGGNGYDDSPEMYLRKNSNGTFSLTGADYTDSNGNVANGFCLDYYKESDGLYAGRFSIYTNYTLTKTSNGKAEPESLDVKNNAVVFQPSENHRIDANKIAETNSK